MMPLTTPDGQEINVEELNREFDRSQLNLPTEATAPAPPKRIVTEPAKKSPAKRSPAKSAAEKKTIAAPSTPNLVKKRQQAGADILNTLAEVSTVLHITTGNDAWEKDAQVYVQTADTFGEACARLAEKSPSFARYLDAEGSGGGAWLGMGLISSQIALAVIDNHDARSKIPSAVEKAVFWAKMKLRTFGRKKK